MGDPAGRAAIEGIIGRMRCDPAVLDSVVDAAREKSPPVAALPVREVRRHIAALLDSVAGAFADPRGLGEGAGVAGALAVERATQGVPLAALLDGFQAGRVHVLLKLTEQARAAGVPTDALIDALVELDSYTNELQNRIIHAYRSAELSFARTGYAVRVQALRDLLHGAEGACAADAGLDQQQRYHCLIADVTDPRQAPRIEAALAPAGGMAGFVDGYLCCLATRLDRAERVADIAVVASPPVLPGELPAAYRVCRAALASARLRGLRGLHLVTQLAAVIAVDAHPELGAMLAGQLLARLDTAKEFHRLLAKTALTYLDQGCHADATAAALHVHPNTVKHRLRRFAELTGFGAAGRPAEPAAQALRWWWSLDAWLRNASQVKQHSDNHYEDQPPHNRSANV
jgi:PucR C-terminal helix-turn-helix domain